jgi:hypothetical protein
LYGGPGTGKNDLFANRQQINNGAEKKLSGEIVEDNGKNKKL